MSKSPLDRRRRHEERHADLKKATFESVADLQRTAIGSGSKAYQNLPPQPRLSTTSNGEQRVQVLVLIEQGLRVHCTTRFLLQEYLNLVVERPRAISNREKVQSGCQEILTLSDGVGTVD